MKKRFLSITSAMLLVCALLLSFSGCFNVTVELPTLREGGAAQANAELPYYNTELTTAPVVEATTIAPVNGETVPPVSEAATNAPAAENTTAAPAAEVTPQNLSGEALLTYFNNAVNKVKSQKAGFAKSKLTSIEDLQLSNSAANALISVVKGALLSETEEVTTVNKGQSSDSVLSPSGKSFASALTMSDVTGVKCEKSGDSYVITVNVKGETNPTLANSACGRVFDFITVEDVISTYAPKVGATVAKEDIEVVFADCYAKLTVNSQGVVTAYETYVKGNMILHNAKIKKVITIDTDVDVTLASTTKYTGFAF